MEAEDLAKLLSLVANPIRVEIIKSLDNKPLSFSELLVELSLKSTSKLSFHLEKLSSLIRKNNEGIYELTSLGENISSLLLRLENDEIQLHDNDERGTPLLTNSSPSHIRLNFRDDFLLMKGFTLVVGIIFIFLLIIPIVSSLNLDPMHPFLIVISITFPLIYLVYYFVLFVKKKISYRIAFFNSFSLLVFCIFTMSLAFTLLNMSFWSNQTKAFQDLVIALFFHDFFYNDIAFISPYITFNLVIFIWITSYFFLLGIAFLHKNHHPSRYGDQISDPQLGNIFSFFNQITLWIIIIPPFSVISILSSDVKYNITPHYFTTPKSILPSTGNIFPTFTQLFPIGPSIMILIAILLKYQLNYFSEISITHLLLGMCIIGPLLLYSVTILDSLMLISSAAMNEPGMIFKLMNFIFSKFILGIIHFFSMVAYSLLLLNSLSISNTHK